MSSVPSERQRAALFIDAGRPTEAMQVLGPLAAADPDDAEIQRLIARALIELRRFGEARRAARRALSLEPGDATAYRLIAVASIRSGDPEDAAQAARTARKLAPTDWRTHFLVVLADCAAKGIVPDTRLSAAEARRLAPNVAEPMFAAGLLAQTVEEWGEAERCYREALRIDPMHPDARNNLAVLRMRKGDHGYAAQTFADLVGENPKADRARHNVAVAYRSAMRWGITGVLAAAMMRMYAELAPLGEEVAPVALAFSAIMTGGAIMVVLAIGIRFVVRLGARRRTILTAIARDPLVFGSVVALAIALVSVIASFVVWPVALSAIGLVAAFASNVFLRAAVARARNRLGR
ncbi:tetratricopeptide repeat protein [Microbacterium sp. ASV49]|uniref:Tetratricopeptide repeat protein n=1 Tax=Microbacterium candidum TaxID=3041922 RepID=A0ABT7N1X7_9MICO|nr:tetratricopeptide repeat protein [Microbacterium sp. ASV49]MDL9980666.1 tetratricopeptide repeat protein [Microbacterium sp. ASV49]